MKLGKLQVFIMLNSIVLIVGFIMCVHVGNRVSRRIYSNVYYLSPITYETKYLLTANEIRNLKRQNENDLISYEYRHKETIHSSITSAEAVVVSTDSNYFYMNKFDFAEGSHWSNVSDDEKVAIISERLAWKLFGSMQVVDNTIVIADEKYLIVGVTKQVTEGSHYSLWASAPHLPSDEKLIGSVIMQKNTYHRVGSNLEVQKALSEIEKNPTDYYRTDLNHYLWSIQLRHKIMMLLFGIIVVVCLTHHMDGWYKNGVVNKKNIIVSASFLLVGLVLVWWFINQLQFSDWVLKPSNIYISDLVAFVFNVDKMPSKHYLNDNALYLMKENNLSAVCFFGE